MKTHQMTEQIKVNRQIIKSLLLIVSIIIISYITFCISLQIVPLIISDPASQYLVIHLSGQILAIASIVDAP
uniref:G_PROTEIN_RECEP_F1_2 domain-containing protein n=1 Tax=Meloidogyne hapla TaxID=6305 RepID=A0A1I8B6B4_MELHA